jgi:hypothetical protein
VKTLVLVLTLLITGCASTPAGKSVARAQYLDIASTGIALAVAKNSSEANPLGVGLLVLKPLFPLAVDRANLPCNQLNNTVRVINAITYGAVTNNISVAIGLASPLAIGVVGGLIYAYWYPDQLKCE